MRLGVWLVMTSAIAGCYAPKASPGAPCDPALENCPSGQTCQATGGEFLCALPGAADPIDAPGESFLDAAIDAAPDASPTRDTDGDGLFDSEDNCPAIANVAQANEDGDRFGDLCDPCPPVADDSPTDQDGDGVSDDCDPRPTQAGDAITLFEGFNNGVPATWFKRGTWTAVPGAVVVAAAGDPGANLTVPGPTTQHETVATSMTILDFPAMSDASAGVVDTWNHSVTKRGVFCHLTTWFDSTDMSYYRPLADNQVGNAGELLDYEMATNAPYVLWQRRDGTSYTCNSLASNGVTTSTPANTSALAVPTPEIGLRAVHAHVRYAWLMVISN